MAIDKGYNFPTESIRTSDNGPQLIIQTLGGVKSIELTTQTTWTIGRSLENDVTLADPSASKHHAKLSINRSNYCYFVDLGSSNGTRLNGEVLKAPAWLKDGDRITIGKTNLTFKQNLETAEHSKAADRSILMVQQSTTQGKIWEEVCKYQNVSMVWEQSSTTLKQTLEENAASNLLPNLLLLDVRDYSDSSHLFHFCRWCTQTLPQIKIFLLDSVREEISKLEHQIALKNGALNYFPALSRHNLVLKSVEVLEYINEVLASIKVPLLSQEDLLSILTRGNLYEH